MALRPFTELSKPFRGLANETGMLLAEEALVVELDSPLDSGLMWSRAALGMSDPKNEAFKTGEVWVVYTYRLKTKQKDDQKPDLRRYQQGADGADRLVGALIHHLSYADPIVVQDEADLDTDWYKALRDHYDKLGKILRAATVTVGDVVRSPKTGRWGFKVKLSVPMSSLPKLPKDSPAQAVLPQMGKKRPPWL